MRHIGFRLLIAFPAALAVAVPVAVSAGPVMSAQAAAARLPVSTTFAPGDFPESLAVDGHGGLYASLGFTGEVVKVTPGGQQQPVASLPVGAGLLTGLAFDPGGNLYVADATFQASPTPPGVFRIGADGRKDAPAARTFLADRQFDDDGDAGHVVQAERICRAFALLHLVVRGDADFGKVDVGEQSE